MKQAALLLFLAAAVAQKPPEQPVAYSHKRHIAAGLKCANCHEMRDPGEMMGIPEVSKCMTCHVCVKKDSLEIRKLAAFVRDGREVPWKRVYQIPSYVLFSHAAHLETGAKCETCHGPVAERDRLWRETDISMGGCMKCHQQNRASNDCTFCHQPLN
ncbi:MAG: cytochrome c3 family protein [Bryobacteraceae bacterium]